MSKTHFVTLEGTIDQGKMKAYNYRTGNRWELFGKHIGVTIQCKHNPKNFCLHAEIQINMMKSITVMKPSTDDLSQEKVELTVRSDRQSVNKMLTFKLLTNDRLSPCKIWTKNIEKQISIRFLFASLLISKAN